MQACRRLLDGPVRYTNGGASCSSQKVPDRPGDQPRHSWLSPGNRVHSVCLAELGS